MSHTSNDLPTGQHLILNAFLMSTGHHEASWRLPESDPFAHLDVRHYQHLAQIAASSPDRLPRAVDRLLGAFRSDLAALCAEPTITGASSGKRPRRRRSAGHAARMRANDAVLGLLSRQDGLITAAQAAEHGLTERTLRRRVHDGGWARVAPGVVLAGGHPWTDRARVRSAGMWARGRGAVSGPAAAWWHGMPAGVPARVELTVPRTCGLRSRRGVRVRRRDLDERDVVHSDGIDLTAPALTALETSVVVPDGSAFLDRALQRHVRFPAIYGAYCRNLGHEGGARIAELLIAAADRADSAAERVLLAILRAAGRVTGWERGVPFGPWTIDVAFPRASGRGAAVDVDSAGSGPTPLRANALARAGWNAPWLGARPGASYS